MTAPVPGRRRSQSRADSFRHAFAGIGYVLRSQPNARIHGAITLAVIIAGLWLKLERLDWVALVLAMAVVWTAEFVNTALEAAIDLASPDYHVLAKLGKDVAAGGVLVAALLSVVIGLLVLGPPLLERVIGLAGGLGE
jgi:diacylglycerol kinase